MILSNEATPSATPTPTTAVNVGNSNTATSTTGNNNNNGNQTETASGTASSETNASNQVNTDTSSTVGTTQSSTANSGSNEGTGSSGVVVTAGDAAAYANLVNLINSSSVGSHVQIYFITLDSGTSGNLDLNAMWKAIQQSASTTGMTISPATSVGSSQPTNVNNEVTVNAGSGGNNTVSINGNSIVLTGDAAAVANVLNFINTYWVATNMLTGVITVRNFNGNIILPRPELFSGVVGGSPGAAGGGPVTVNNNIATQASTGENQANGNSSTIATGNGTAASSTENVLGQIMNGNNAYQITVNGKTLLDILTTDPSRVGSIPAIGGYGAVNLTNWIKALAASGGNSAAAAGMANITTGNAYALANLFNYINSQWWYSNWFRGIINVVGDWHGKIIFAYPDLAIAVDPRKTEEAPGGTLTLTLHWTNQGYDEARNSRIYLSLPPGTRYLSDTSGVGHQITGDKVSWDYKDLSQGSSGNFQVNLEVDPNIFNETSAEGPVKSVWAASNTAQKLLTAYAQISSTDPDADLTNNSATSEIVVEQNLGDTGDNGYNDTLANSSEGTDHRQPVIVIGAKNNVGEFVYPNDVVTFEIKVKNSSDAPLLNGQLVHRLVNPQGKEIFSTTLPIGKINPFREGTIRFGLPLTKVFGNAKVVGGSYQTVTQVQGVAVDGTGVSSNEANTTFIIKSGQVVTAAVQPTSGVIMGVQDSQQKPVNLLPYLLLLMSSSSYLWMASKRLMHQQTVSWVSYSIILVVFGIFLFTASQLLYYGKHNNYIVNLPKPDIIALRALTPRGK